MAGYPPSDGYVPSPDSYTSSSDHPPTTSRGFDHIESDEQDDRIEMEANIEKICNAVQLSRGKLAFHSNDIIEENALNVGPQHNLETIIDKKIEKIEAHIRKQNKSDNIPQSVYDKLKAVIKIANDCNASTFTASSSLETVMDAFEYGRTAANNDFDLKRGSKIRLQQYDETFINMIQSQIDFDLNKADSEIEECFHLLWEAVKESRIDKTQLLERQTNENQLVDIQQLNDIQLMSSEELHGEEIEYAEIQRKCRSDIGLIEASLDELTTTLSLTMGIHRNRETERFDKLQKNRNAQNDLKERLKQLEAEENEYLRVEKEEEEMMETAQNDYSRGEAELIELKDKIAMLGKQASASLQILEVMKGCTDEILVDAKKRKTETEKKLKQLEIESLLNTRDVLIASLCLHKMEAEDCSSNIEQTNRTVSNLD